jgi:hypothetical protein
MRLAGRVECVAEMGNAYNILVGKLKERDHSEDRPTERPTNRPTDQPTNQPTNQQINCTNLRTRNLSEQATIQWIYLTDHELSTLKIETARSPKRCFPTIKLHGATTQKKVTSISVP